MIDLSKLFDEYGRQARLYPALLTLLPAIVTVLAWFPDLTTKNVGGLAVTIATSCGLIFYLADLGRSRGKDLEPRLLRSWGGWPTTIWLRHRDDHLPALVKARYHAYLSEHAVAQAFPTAEDEQKDPAAADAVYDAAVMWLKEQTRKDKLVNKEVAVYGFRRNLLGMKPIGLGISALSVMVSISALVYLHHAISAPKATTTISAATLGASPAVLGSLIFALIACIAWALTVRASWVRVSGDQYARALLAACDKPKKAGKAKKSK